jgi:hypothetical protein
MTSARYFNSEGTHLNVVIVAAGYPRLRFFPSTLGLLVALLGASILICSAESEFI